MKATCGSKKENGLSIVEFTVVSSVILVLLFGVIELSRFVFSLQLMNEVTRKAARLAAVCYVDNSTDIAGMDAISSIASNDLSSSLVIEYLDGDGNVLDMSIFDSSTDSATLDVVFKQIRFVRARIDNFQFDFSLLARIFGTSVLAPTYQTTIPAESLGIYRPIGEDDDIPTGNCSKS
ncbi:TadE/TadG family type IV pilus assembly protein [Vibrio breoganii]|uniref:TadE/TadG family type IV pilus assembly protein n=1 Tax=Vibrio breoganii TaxID=553239 RepID=UPI00037222A3|nr:TadE family protein [Vibrio breoganii]OCH72768.1 hypothetical protein A6D95_17340 [Vibrio breoganii]OED94529.1 hypothetical protein A1QG_07335 [Vibrio breoganii ZF-29]OEF82765.1 hypothetical protein B003_01805 [Vibrio breoganii 1C10]PMG99270.1 hypothetical protein BCU79_03790 [Vibrio breoganii]PML12886.1 hypothetical protein BCT84_15090 [Vibrio breoganii]